MTQDEIAYRLKMLEKEQEHRKELDFARRNIPGWFFICTLVMCISAFVIGVQVSDSVGIVDDVGLDRDINISTNHTYETEDHTFYFTMPEEDERMEGNYGYTWVGAEDIYINRGLLEDGNFNQVRRTCRHERLHTLGIGEDGHDMIDIYERQINDPVCMALMPVLKERYS